MFAINWFLKINIDYHYLNYYICYYHYNFHLRINDNNHYSKNTDGNSNSKIDGVGCEGGMVMTMMIMIVTMHMVR